MPNPAPGEGPKHLDSLPTKTRWNHYLAYFFGGLFLTNAVPHFVNGVSGLPFQSPFASPPGEGLSSSTVNVIWGFANLVVGYLLVCRVGSFRPRRTSHAAVFAVGVLVMGIMGAHAFGRFHGGNDPLRVEAIQPHPKGP